MQRGLFGLLPFAALLFAMPAAASAEAPSDIEQIKAALHGGCAAFMKGDKAGAMAPFQDKPGLVIFDFSPPRAKDYAALKHDNDAFADMVEGRPICEYLEIHPTLLSKDAAYSWAIMRFATKFKDGRAVDVTFRSTDVWRKIDGRWYSVHEQNSFPVDIFTGKADLQSKP